MKELVTKSVVKEICNDFALTIIDGLDECKEDFPYTLACINFITELREKDIDVDLNAFIDIIWSKLHQELSNYLAR
jgi:hypothetical protein